ncbi:MAG TPA: hypothetical protein VL197_09365 [Nitrospirota bacterium]|nr:hypothetical protein [Nitrospirota bacterium]
MKLKVQFAEPENPAHQDINSHSLERVFSSPEGLDPAELRSLACDAVHLTASGCEAAGAKDVSHVKAFIEHSSGFLHADTVGGNGEIMVAGRDGNKTKRFRLVMNAVIYGLSEESIRKASEQAIEAVQVQYGLNRDQAKEKNQ